MALFSPHSAASPGPQASTKTIDYFQKHQVGLQWRAFLVAAASELFQSAEPEDVEAFWRQVGTHMAGIVALARLETLEELEDEINQALSGMDWGYAELTALDDGIEILHSAAPSVLPEDTAGYWTASFAAVLEGLYTQWFIDQGSQDHLATRCIETPQPGSFLLRHGR